MNQPQTLTLDRYIRARYPLIAVVTFEENRVQADIKAWAAAKTRLLYSWTITTGLRFDQVTPDGKPLIKFDPDSTTDPAAALREISEKYPADAPATLFVLKDLHKYMTDPVIMRFLRDLVDKFGASKHTIILISPAFQPPQDLEKSMVVIDWPLPDAESLEKILKRVERGLPATVPVTLNGGRRDVIQAMRGLTEFEAESVLLSAVIATGELGEGMVPFIVQEKKQIIRKAGILEFFEETATMNDVGGLSNLKQYARRKLATFSDKAEAAGVTPARGVILLGVPGTGKSLSAKAFAAGRLPLLRLDIGAVMGSLVGQSEANIRSALKTAEAVAPAILWIDEIEKALGGGGGERDGGTSMRVFGTILTWMQEKTAPVYVIATANDISGLRPELVRRFDDVIFVDLPSLQDRIEVLRIHLCKRRQNPDAFDLAAVAAETRGFTGAELEKVIANALEFAFLESKTPDTALLIQSAGSVIPIAESMNEQINALRVWAQARALPAADSLEPVALSTGARTVDL